MDSPCTRLSVRRLVEFSLRAGDLTPANAAAMYAGMLGHMARQQQSGAENERAVRWTGTRAGIALELYGRADIFYPTQDPPLVEELKLCAAQPPAAPLPAHRAQALCYAFMLCEELGLSQIALRVSYITQQGDVCAVFDETLTREQAAAEFEAIVLPYARFRALQDDYLAQRNASIAQLPFPYPAFRPGQREMAARRYTPPSCGKSGCSPACPPARAKAPPRCFRRSRRWARVKRSRFSILPPAAPRSRPRWTH